MIWPSPLQPVLRNAIQTLFALREKHATVEDAAEATITLYDVVTSVPNIAPEDVQLGGAASSLPVRKSSGMYPSPFAGQAGRSVVRNGMVVFPGTVQRPKVVPRKAVN